MSNDKIAQLKALLEKRKSLERANITGIDEQPEKKKDSRYTDMPDDYMLPVQNESPVHSMSFSPLWRSLCR